MTTIDIDDAIIGAVTDVTKDWAKQRKAEERDRARIHRRYDALAREDHVSIKDAAWEVMEKAYLEVSDDDQLPARPRQIMYVARPLILERTDKEISTVAISPRPCCRTTSMSIRIARIGMWFGTRGHFTEPHTGHQFGLGTSEIREYLHYAPSAATPSRSIAACSIRPSGRVPL
jgi:hypothetical protein